MKARLGIRLAVATALALGALGIGTAVKPDEAKAAPAVCVEVHTNPSGAPIVRWTCIGSINPPCTDENRFDAPWVGFSWCIDLT